MILRAIATAMAVMAVGSVIAHSDTIGLYGDWWTMNCNLADQQPGLLPVYIVHVSTEGATASEFSAPKPACMTAVWLSDNPPWEIIGSSQTGMAIGYGSCKTGVIRLFSILYFGYGTTEPCCQYPVLPSALSEPHGIWTVDCDYNLEPATGLVATINGNAACPCGYSVPVEETSWGRVKELYVE